MRGYDFEVTEQEKGKTNKYCFNYYSRKYDIKVECTDEEFLKQFSEMFCKFHNKYNGKIYIKLPSEIELQ